jgi:hypothetical protein
MAMPRSLSPDQRFRNLQLICWGFLGAQVIYVVIARAVTGQVRGHEGLPSLLPWILLGAAVAAVFSAPLIAGAILRAGEARQDRDARLDAYQQAVIVGFALREAAGIVGIVLAFLTGNWLWAAGLCGGAALAMATGWPTRGAFDHMAGDPAVPPPIG